MGSRLIGVQNGSGCKWNGTQYLESGKTCLVDCAEGYSRKTDKTYIDRYTCTDAVISEAANLQCEESFCRLPNTFASNVAGAETNPCTPGGILASGVAHHARRMACRMPHAYGMAIVLPCHRRVLRDAVRQRLGPF